MPRPMPELQPPPSRSCPGDPGLRNGESRLLRSFDLRPRRRVLRALHRAAQRPACRAGGRHRRVLRASRRGWISAWPIQLGVRAGRCRGAGLPRRAACHRPWRCDRVRARHLLARRVATRGQHPPSCHCSRLRWHLSECCSTRGSFLSGKPIQQTLAGNRAPGISGTSLSGQRVTPETALAQAHAGGDLAGFRRSYRREEVSATG
jgi:hypothetical protein